MNINVFKRIFYCTVAVLLLSGFSSPPPCCPEVEKIGLSPASYQCSGEPVKFFFKVSFRRSNEEFCETSSDDIGLFSLYNQTDKTRVPFKMEHISKGLYQNKAGGLPIPLSHSSRLVFTVAGDTACGKGLTRYFTGLVIGKNGGGSDVFGYRPGIGPWVNREWLKSESTATLKQPLTQLPTPPNESPWMAIPVDTFGAKVSTTYLVNLQPFEVEVSFKGLHTKIPAKGKSEAFRGIPANGTWQIRINQKNYDEYLKNSGLIFFKVGLSCSNQ